MRRFIRALVALGGLCILGYGGGLVWLVANETRIVFQAGRPLGQARPAPPFQQIDVPRVDGARQIAFTMPRSPDAPWVLYLHGNDATIATRQNISRCEQLRALGLNVLAVEYRGFGGLAGLPTEESVTADARAGYDYVRGTGAPARRVILYGWSLGSAIAVNLASTVETGGVILEGAPASLVAIGERQYPYVPIRFLMRNPFESIGKIDRVGAPILFLHSPEDDIVPIEEGRRLFDAAREPKRFVEVRGGHIYASDTDGPAMYSAIRSFLRSANLVK